MYCSPLPIKKTNLRGVARNRNLQGNKDVDCDCTQYCAEGFNESCQCFIARDTSTTPPTDLDLINTTCYCNDELKAAGTCEETYKSYKDNNSKLCLQKGKPKTNVDFVQNTFTWYDCQVEGDNEAPGSK